MPIAVDTPVHTSIQNVSARHGISQAMVIKAISNGDILTTKLGRRVLVDLASVDAWLATFPRARCQERAAAA